MTRRRVSSYRPFTFQADFSPPVAEPKGKAEDSARLSAAEFATLGAKLQAEAISKARDPLDALAAERLDHAIARLGDALEAFSELADTLDTIAHETGAAQGLARPARRAAQAIRDGQGDLFAVCQSLRAQSGTD